MSSNNQDNEKSQQSRICKYKNWLSVVLVVLLFVFIWCKNQEQSSTQVQGNSTQLEQFIDSARGTFKDAYQSFGQQGGGDYLLSLI